MIELQNSKYMKLYTFPLKNIQSLASISFFWLTDNILKEEQDLQCKRLLQKQYNSKERLGCDSINAEILLKLIIMPNEDLSEYDKRVKARCCNLPLLESIF